jgi:hypothetical protein
MSSFSRRDWRDYISDDEDDYPQEEPFYFENKYLYDYYWYHENFPVEWAMCPKEGTGPGQCGNCLDYGCINDVFIGYCANCAIYDYEGSRGRGFIDVGIEYDDPCCMDFTSVFETYLKDVDINAIVGVDNTMPNDYHIDNPVPETCNGYCDNESIDQSEITDEDIYGNEDIDIGEHSGIECHFEGGYNDM